MREFIVSRDDGVQERRRFKIQNGSVVYFVVQLEILIENEWRPIIRWDNSHSVPDCDRYNLQGDKDKFTLSWMKPEQVFTNAQRSLNRSWHQYVEDFLRGDFPGWQPPYTSIG